jgi:hypothetical protein
MNEIDRLNRLPVSLHAQALMKQAGHKPDPSLPYLLQLLSWAIHTGRVEIHVHEPGNPHSEFNYADFLDFALYRKPERIMHVLLEEGPDEGAPDTKWVDAGAFLAMETLEDAASYLGDCFASAMGW